MSDESVDATDAHLHGIIDEYMGAFEPDPEETVGLRERILQIVREDAALAPATKLTTERGNPFRISTAEVRGIIREAVDAVPGIRARSVNLTPAGEPEGSAVEVALTVMMSVGTAFVSAAEDVRRSVAGALIAQVGIPALRIDVTLEDAFVDEEAGDD